MPKADQPHTMPIATSPSRHARPSPQYVELAAKLADANAAAAAFVETARASAKYLRKHHGYSLASFAACTRLHKNSLMRIAEPEWVPKPDTLRKLDTLIIRAEAKRRGEMFPGETIKRGRPNSG